MRRPIVSLLSLVFVAAACSGGSVSPTIPTTAPPATPPPTSTTTSFPLSTTTSMFGGPAAPLNGLPLEGEALAERRVLAVKIDNHASAQPQSGLQEADAVYELLVESGITRFIALFHADDSEYVGPIRSGRPTDAELLKPLEATFAISGGSNWILRFLRNRALPLIGEGQGMFRISDRSAPYNLYGNTALLREVADGRGYSDEPPPVLFHWSAFGGDEPMASTIVLEWSPGNLVEWRWDGERYLRFVGDQPHEYRLEDGTTGQLAFDTLVVIFARRYTARPPDPSDGVAVPASDTVGSGRVLVFAHGRVLEGQWSRSNFRDPILLTDADGAALSVPPGVPWISIFPDHRSVSIES